MASPIRVRSLAPKEHGAYAQLGLPLLTGLALGRPGAASFLLGASFVSALFAHEPLLVVMGRRGERARLEDGARAWRRLLLLTFVSLASLALAVALGPHAVRGALLVPTALGLATALVVITDTEKTLLGEWLVAAALSSTLVPLAVAGGRSSADAIPAFAVFVLGFAASVLAVRATIATKKRGLGLRARVLPVLGVVAAALALVRAHVVPAYVLLCSAPMLVGSLVLAVFPPPPRALMRVGWTLVVTNLVTVVLIVLAAR